MMMIASPHAYSKPYTGAEISAGSRMALEGRAWMEGNEQAFRSIMAFLSALQRRGEKGRVRDRVVSFCIAKGIEINDSPYRFANGKWAAISRYAALVDPSLVGNPLQFNDSLIDVVGLHEISYLDLEGEKE